MKFISALSLALLTGANAVAIPSEEVNALEKRQGTFSNELKSGACKAVTFLFARGSTESDNMGSVVGPDVCSSLKARLGSGNVACQGIGNADGYPAALGDNFLSQNTSPGAINAAVSLFNLANTKCPNTKIVAGGYSQGTAVVSGAIQRLSSTVQNKVTGVVFFGFTRNQQDRGRIPGFPTNKLKVYCNFGDLVCDGTLTITAAHLTYGSDASNAAAFLAGTTR